MANSDAGTSSGAAPASGSEYQVFLSFRGLDTRHAFTDFLFHGLQDAGVRVFKDEVELKEGEVIGDNLLRAINSSMLYIPIFSRNYASSKWCLRELALMVDNVSKSGGRKNILPIFFDVEPEDVKLRTPVYNDFLLEHAKKSADEVKVWRAALEEAGKIKGWNMKKDQRQPDIVKSIVVTVLEKLKTRQKLVPADLFGLDDRVKHVEELLNVNCHDVRLIAIYGVGGIGKTTVAKVVFNRLSSHFGKRCSFLDDVRENSSTKEGIVKLQKKLLSDIVGPTSAEGVADSEHGTQRIRHTLSTEKVLVVLDDVAYQEHIQQLIGNCELHSGSRIIVTTRNKEVLQVGFKGAKLDYEMPKMDDGPALHLFFQQAFRGDCPSDKYHELSTKVVASTGGLPLAIVVLGSSLYAKDEQIWEEKLEKLRKVPEKKILEKLKISYDDLEEHQQHIFLDIACFFFNESQTDAIYIWTDCELYPKGGIKVLIDRCLIKILDNDKIWMHDQLIALGRQIVREESRDDPGKRSRLWNTEDALQIIRTKERNHKVQMLEINGQDGSTVITSKQFEMLEALRVLKLRYGIFSGDFAQYHSKLRWISWEPCGNFKADNMYLGHLVVLKLGQNSFTDDSKAWDLIKGAKKLKVLSLTDCHGITTVPDFSECLGLERLTLAHCDNLKRIGSFIGKLQSLIKLEIIRCIVLTDLPEELGSLVKLKHLSLQKCHELRELPRSLENLTSLIELDLSNTKIKELPNSIGKLQSLCTLRLRRYRFASREHNAWQLPSSIGMLEKLEVLNISMHNEMTGEIPLEFGELSSLRILNLEHTGISGIPRTINRLHRLQRLNLRGCMSIQELPELPTSLTCLLFMSESLLSVPNLSNLTNLVQLELHEGYSSTKKSKLLGGCNLSWMWRLRRLKSLSLMLRGVPAPSELAYLSHLEELTLWGLDLENLETLEQLPSSLLRLQLSEASIGRAELPSSCLRLPNLSTLELVRCEVENIPLEGLPLLEKLNVVECTRLRGLSIPLETKKLREVYVSGCHDLIEIQVVGLSKSLKHLSVRARQPQASISGLSYLKNLETLTIDGCRVLTNVEGLVELPSLKSLHVCRCPSLVWLIDASRTNIPDDCFVHIIIEDSIPEPKTLLAMTLKRYREKIPVDASNKINQPFTIVFVLGVKKNREGFGFVGVVQREKENVTPGSVTYEGLINEVKGFGFRPKRLWYKAPSEDRMLHVEIKSGEQVNDVMPLASKRGFVHLYVEGRFDGEPSKASNPVEDQRGLSSLEHTFTIIFHLGVKNPSRASECLGGIERKNKNVTPHSVTYDGLIAEIKGFGFRLKRMWCESLGVYCHLFKEITSDEEVKEMVQLASKRGSAHLYVEGGVDSNYEGEYDDEIMKMLKEEWAMKTDVYSDEDGAEWDDSSPDDDSDSESVDESEIDDTSSIEEIQLEPGDVECFEATGNRRRMKDGRVGDSRNVGEAKATNTDYRKEGKDERGEPADQNDAVLSSSPGCGGVEHQESYTSS